jgi:hypothetical protein
MVDKTGEARKGGDRTALPQLRPDLRAKFAQAMMIARGYTAPAARAAFQRIEEATAPGGLDTEHWVALHGRYGRHLFAGELRAALEVTEFQMREARSAGLPMLVATAHRQISVLRSYLGLYAEAREHGEIALAMYDERWAGSARAFSGYDFFCAARTFLALSLCILGDLETAADMARQAVHRAQEVGEPFSLAFALAAQAGAGIWTNNPQAALRAADAMNDVTISYTIGSWGPQAKLIRGWAVGRLSDAKTGVREAREAWSVLRELGAHLYDTLALALVADLEASNGAINEALDLID